MKNPKQANVDGIASVFLEFVRLKQLYRQGWLNNGVPHKKCESVADHSMGVALLAMLLADSYFPELDSTKIIRMALLHDFGEIYAGDITPDENVSLAEKHTRESESIHKVLETLDTSERYLELWEEFEAGQSPEAKLVKEIDRLEMGLQAHFYEQEERLDLSDFFQAVDKAVSLPELRAVINSVRQTGKTEDVD